MTRFDRYLGKKKKKLSSLESADDTGKIPLHISPTTQQSLQPHLLFQWPSPSLLAYYSIWPQLPWRNSCSRVVPDLLVPGLSTSFGQRLRWNGFHLSLRVRVQQHRGQCSPGTPPWWWQDVLLVLPCPTLGLEQQERLIFVESFIWVRKPCITSLSFVLTSAEH